MPKSAFAPAQSNHDHRFSDIFYLRVRRALKRLPRHLEQMPFSHGTHKISIKHRACCIAKRLRQAKDFLRACALRKDSESSRARAKSHPGICNPLIHSQVSNDSLSGH